MADLNDWPALGDAIIGDLRKTQDLDLLRGVIQRQRGELASLTTERDRLRGERDAARSVLATAREDPDWDPAGMVMLYDHEVDRADRAEAERDTAQALLVEEQRDHAATRADADSTLDYLRRHLAAAEAELERQRPVIEAAWAWAAGIRRISQDSADKRANDELRSKNRQALQDAVDALGSTQPSTLEPQEGTP